MLRISALLIAAALALAACGKVGNPETVPGGRYPTSYPTH